MPFPSESLDVLPNHGQLAHLALRGAPLSPLGLALDAPRVTVLLYVRHAVFEGIAAFCAEKVTVMPMMSKGNNVLPKDGRLAMLAARGEKLMPVQMTIQPEPVIPILRHGLSRDLLEHLASGATLDTLEAVLPEGVRLGAYFECLQAGPACKARKTLRVELKGRTCKRHKSTL